MSDADNDDETVTLLLLTGENDDDDNSVDGEGQQQQCWCFQRVSGLIVLVLVIFVASVSFVGNESVLQNFKLNVSSSTSSSSNRMHHDQVTQKSKQQRQPSRLHPQLTHVSTAKHPDDLLSANNKTYVTSSSQATKQRIETNETNASSVAGAINRFPDNQPPSNKTGNHHQKHSVTIVTQLSGELGNNIAKLATGVALALEWPKRTKQQASATTPRNQQDTHNNDWTVDLLLRHQNHPKWVQAAANLQACFVNTATLNVSAANTPEFDRRQAEQKRYRLTSSVQQRDEGGNMARVKTDTGKRSSNATSLADMLDRGINSYHEDTYGRKMEATLNWLLEHWDELAASQNETNRNDATARGGGASISFPFMYANHLVGQDFWMDRYYDAFRRFFAWDFANPKCCSSTVSPSPDETVFHFRNFVEEMPRKGVQRGYQELGPHQVAHDLLGHLRTGDKVAVLTRFPHASIVQDYLKAMRARGLQVRLIGGDDDKDKVSTNSSSGATTTLHDFCFLLSAQKEVVGIARSSFFYWAGILGQADTVRAYSVDSPAKRQSGTPLLDAYNWTHPELQRRVVSELYKAADG